jgi:hypothetical protein
VILPSADHAPAAQRFDASRFSASRREGFCWRCNATRLLIDDLMAGQRVCICPVCRHVLTRLPSEKKLPPDFLEYGHAKNERAERSR